MDVAIIAVTNAGSRLADQLAASLPDSTTVYVKAGRELSPNQLVFSSLGALILDIFYKYDAFVFIMAAGIVVRVISPYISDKRLDPAVVVMDDQGKHAISILSGHIGGANELTKRVSEVVGAQPVITTATDLASKPAVDTFATGLGLAIEPFEYMKLINSSLANNEHVAFFLDTEFESQSCYFAQAKKAGVILNDITKIEEISFDAAVLITNKAVSLTKPHVFLRTPNLAIGIGCRRGTPMKMIADAVDDACKNIGRSIQSISIIGSSTLKSNECGLLDFARRLAVPIKFFSNEQVQECITKNSLEISKFVENQIGVGNVCEAAALLTGQASNLLLPKTKYPNVTVAIAEVK